MKYTTLQELFAEESRWTQGEFARDEIGRWGNPSDPKAVSFCLLGGLELVYGLNTEAFKNAWRKLRAACGKEPSGINDSKGTTIADIQRVVREAGV